MKCIWEIPIKYTALVALAYVAIETVLAAEKAKAAIHYVNPGQSIQNVIANPNVVAGDEIIVFQGTYVENINFNGKNIILRSTEPNNPDIVADTIIDGNQNGSVVTFNSGEDANCVLSGFTITNGSGRDYVLHYYQGGGMYIVSNPTITKCTFTNNRAWYGGGMYTASNPTITKCTFTNNLTCVGGGILTDHGNPTITSCTFTNNLAAQGLGGGMASRLGGSPIITKCTFNGNSAMYGGGMYNYDESSPTLNNCIFSGNDSSYGGGMHNFHSSPTLNNCIFSGNDSSYGGGMHNEYESNPTITNCTFTSNSANYGGGMATEDSNPTLNNCTFSGNWAANGNALACDSYARPSNVQMTNSILWDGGNEIWNNDGSTIIVIYSDVQGGWPGTGNINTDPNFADPGYWDPNGTPEDANDDYWVNGDYHLKSQAGRWDPNSETWVYDNVTSPCIDAGNPNSDYTAELWPHGKLINMGAYGGTPEASMSSSDEGNIANLDNDPGDIVGFNDLRIFLNKWLEEKVLLKEDLNRNGEVNFDDYSIFANEYQPE